MRNCIRETNKEYMNALRELPKSKVAKQLVFSVFWMALCIITPIVLTIEMSLTIYLTALVFGVFFAYAGYFYGNMLIENCSEGD